jgi:hypothetical protein
VSHFNQATKGRIVRALLEDGADPRTPTALAGVLEKLRAAMPAREATRRYSEGFGWEEVGRANRALLTGVAADGFEHRRSVESVRAAQRQLAASLAGVD